MSSALLSAWAVVPVACTDGTWCADGSGEPLIACDGSGEPLIACDGSGQPLIACEFVTSASNYWSCGGS
jgi:hypothetical protein